MANPASLPVLLQVPMGQKGPRGEILVALKRAGRLTARELGQLLSLSLNAVRHHLKELELERLVVYERVQQGVGAPVFAYRLSAEAERLFPHRYEEALTDLLEHLVEREGREAAIAALEAHFARRAARLRPQLDGLDTAERVTRLAEALSADGYMAEGTAGICCGTLTEHHCPMRAVADRFPELCEAERRFLTTLLERPVERKQHRLAGDGACQYRVRLADEGAPDAPGTGH